MTDEFRYEFQSVRGHLVNKALYILPLLGLPALLATIFRALELGCHPLECVYLSLYLVSLVAIIFMKKLSFAVRTSILFGILLLTGTGSLVYYGLAANGILILATLSILTAVLFGTRNGIIATGISLLIIATIGTSVVNNQIPFVFDTNRYLISTTAWVTVSLCFVFLVGIAVISSGSIQQFLIRTFQEISKYRKNLEKMVTLRTSALTKSNEKLKKALNDLNKNQQLIDQMVHNIEEVFWIRDAVSAEMLYITPGFEKIFGISCETVYEHSMAFIDLVEKSDQPRIRKAHQKQMKDGRETVTEYRITTPDGGKKWIRAKTKPIFDENGVLIRTVGIAADITELKRSEWALKESRTILRTVFDTTPSCIFVKDIEGKYILVNNAIADLYNISKSEMLGKTDYDLAKLDKLTHKQAESFASNDIEVIKKGEPKLIQGEPLTDIEGNIHWFQTVKVPISLPNNEHCMLGVATDISERKLSEEALRKSEEKFSRFFFSSPTWLAFTRLEDGKYIEVNNAFEKLTGFSRAETIGLSSLEIGLWDDMEKRERLMKTAREKGGFQEQEVTFFTKEKVPLTALWSAVVVEMDGEDCLLSTVMDISELKRAEQEKASLIKDLQQAQKMEAIGNLAGGIAHEFNNVLSIILGNAELAMDDVPSSNPARESLLEIRKASFRAKDVVRQILSFARKTMTALKPLEINTIIKESLKLMRASIPAMIDIEPDIPPVPSVILGDPTEIHQIVINLCNNAAHSMKETGGVLEIGISDVTLDERTASRYEDLSPGDFVKLTVKDSGEGIAPNVLEKVFEPYFTTKEFGAGSGMGLAVVYGLVKKCGGAIKINSRVGEGTTVVVLFPKIEEKIPAKAESEGELPTGSERVLLVDDDPAIVNMICLMLERLGYNVTSTTDSTTALKRFKTDPGNFDLVITDMAMPKMSGDRLAAELLNVRNDIPILLCTGHSDTVDEKKAKEIGIRGFAMKPLDMRKLAQSVRAVLDMR